MQKKAITSSAPKRTGRPSSYTQEFADKICDLIAEGRSERSICKMAGMPSMMTLWRWKEQYPEFRYRSVCAREASAEIFNERRIKKAQDLYDEAIRRLQAGEDFPRGVVEAIRASMQEDAREAGNRDDRNFGDRKRVALTGADGGAVKVESKTEYDLSQLTIEQLTNLEEILMDAENSKSPRDSQVEGS